MMPSPFSAPFPSSAWVTHPIARSIGRTAPGFLKMESPVTGIPGLTSPPTAPAGSAVGAAWM